MKIASHNSFTYLRPRRWWMRPFAFMARCQRVNWVEQWAKYGADLFDLRVRIDTKARQPYFCHGLMRFEGSVWARLGDMNKQSRANNDSIFVRVVLEDNKPTAEEIALFQEFCRFIEMCFLHLRFFGGNDRSDWGCRHPYYKFKTPAQDVDDKYSSTTTLFPRGFKWLRYLDDLCPILYARLHNRRNIERGTSHVWLFIDFVDIR